jgi:hypothetical protein
MLARTEDEMPAHENSRIELAARPAEFARSQAEFSWLQKLCQRSFPGRLEQRISQIEALADRAHPTLAWSLSWREGGRPRVERLIARRYVDPWTWWSLDDHDKTQREWTVMRWLYAQDLPVPQPYAFDQEQGQPFLLAPRPTGHSLSVQEARTGDLDSIIEPLAALTASLHRLAPPAWVREVLPPILVSAEQALIQALDQLAAHQVEALPPCVLHGDPHPGHLLRDARGITAWLNWENSALADPRWDVARITNWLRSQQLDTLPERFVAAYQTRGATALADMPFWEALAAVQSWATAAWVHTELEQGNLERSAATDHFTSVLDTWREQAWRALTRLRHETEKQDPKPET